MIPFRKTAYKYALWGTLFGLLFPILATILESRENYGKVDFSSIFASQQNSPLLWIINTAPFFLGLFAYLIGRQADATQLKNREILRAQQQLILQEKMATIGHMTAGIAHEIKNPLNLVTNFSESSAEIADEVMDLLTRYQQHFSDEDFINLVEMIGDLKQNALDVHSNGHRANDIVHALMDHTRGNKGNPGLTDLNTLIESNVNLAYQGYRANHPAFNLTIDRDYDQDIPRILVNPHSLGRVILNILNNACYAVDQKQIELGSNYAPRLRITTKRISQSVEIRIRDNGLGIPKGIQHSIFEPFFTTKPSGQASTGLGLSISKDIVVQEHLGSLDLETEDGMFTEFIIKLPFGKTS